MLAALGAADADRPTLVIKVDARTTSIAILEQQQLLLFRTLENTRGVTITGEQLAEEVYPSVVFFQDTYHLNIDQIFVAGLPDIRRSRTGAAGANRSRGAGTGQPSQLGGSAGSIPRWRMAGVVGALACPSMRIDINLATQPYEDPRRFWLRWGGALAALGIYYAGAGL